MGKYSRIEIDSNGKSMVSIDEDLNISYYIKNAPASNFALLKNFQVNLNGSPMKTRTGLLESDMWSL